jgi:hypothetical protein
MSIIAWPAGVGIRRAQWAIDEPAQVNRSEFTGRRQVVLLAIAPRWRVSVEFAPLIGQAAILALRAFLLDLKGQANTFKLVAVEASQISGVAPLVNGAGQTGYALVTDGWGADGLKLLRGQFVTVNDQLLMLSANVTAAGGAATLVFNTALRVAPADNAPITVDLPYALLALSAPSVGWSVDPGQIYGVTLTAEEAY